MLPKASAVPTVPTLPDGLETVLAVAESNEAART